MILHQIELQGFLSHRGTPQGDGGFGFCVVDFSRSPLWLIHGENGSGKSALFDAICFALYKRARGAGAGGHSSTNLGYLVHHQADRAQVRVTIEIGGAVYRVDRAVNHISKTPGNSSQIWQSKTDWETLRQMPAAQREQSYDAVNGTRNKAEEWIARELRMSFETFTYTALLRQGETDAFLVAEADKRKSCLLQLLDLSSFEGLGAAAAKESSEAKKLASTAATRRDGTRAVTPAEAENAAHIAREAQEKWQDAQAVFQGAGQALQDGQKAALWQGEMADLNAQTLRDAPLLSRKDETVKNANRARELGQILPRLEFLWGAKARLAGEERSWNSIKAQLERAEQNGRALQDQLAPAQKEVIRTQAAQIAAKAALEAARQADQNSAADAVLLEQIEKWEAQIARADGFLAPLRALLAREFEITSQSKRLGELNARVPLLEHWEQTQKSEQKAAKTLGEAQSARAQAALGWDAAHKNAQIGAGEAERADDCAQRERDGLRDLKAEFAQLKKDSDNRRKVEDEGVCHFCGSTLEGEHIQQRLHEERAQWQRRGHQLNKQIQERELNLQSLEAAARTAQQQNEALALSARKSQSALERADYAIETAQESLGEKQENARRAAAKCHAFAAQIEVLGELQAELNALEGRDLNGEIDALHGAKQQAVAGETTIANARGELEKLPHWAAAQRADVRGARAQTRASLSAADQTLRGANEAAQIAQSAFSALEKQLETHASQLKYLANQSADLAERCERVSDEIGKLHGELPAVWRNHLCCQEAQVLQELKLENSELKGALDEEIALRKAAERAQESTAKIAALRARLDELPAQHKGDVAALRAALEEAESANASAELAWKELDKIERQLELDAREFAAREAELLDAETEAALCKTLAEALGRNGLQRAIQEKAQQKLKAEADKTLLKLSGGEWSISLQETSEDRLEIWATDHRSGHDKKFEYLSGGEKFRIAVALAVAIGQSATGSAPLGTLIIDEGFGTLDAPNRKRMVGELQRLSADVFGGGRVIVVSHQEDVCDDFPQRYAIARDANGLVSATRFPAA